MLRFACLRAVLSLVALMVFSATAPAAVPAAERDALVALHAATAGSGWTAQTNWLTGDPCENSWHGVVCSAAGGADHVSELHLSNNNLVGQLPDLSALSALRKFNVDDNLLTGSLATLAELPALEAFWGSRNQFAGFLPDLPRMTALEYFWVMGNQLIGPIPDISQLTLLKDFRVSTNRLTGVPPQAPSGLNPGGSSLCPNYLHPGSPSDAAWSAATGELDWSRWCTPGYLVSASASAGGSISPLPGIAVLPGESATFTVAADAGHRLSGVTSSCGGSLTGDDFTTGPVDADCTVAAAFRANAVQPVPMLGEWALAALGMLAAALGLRRLRRG